MTTQALATSALIRHLSEHLITREHWHRAPREARALACDTIDDGLFALADDPEYGWAVIRVVGEQVRVLWMERWPHLRHAG